MKFGAELEFTASVLNAGNEHYGTFYEYLQVLMTQSAITDWKIENDNSCGNEIVSPILNGDAGLKSLMQVCYCANKASKDLGISRLTGIDCGIHFHFDATKLNHIQIRNVLLITSMVEPLFYGMNPTSRFATNFAAPLNFNLFQCIRARDIIDLRDVWFRSYMGVDAHPDSYRYKNQEYFPEFINSKKLPHKYDWTRYHGMNFVALFKHGTIEFRYAHGSFDEHIVKMWYMFFKAIMETAINNKTRRILKSNMPFTMAEIRDRSLTKLQYSLFRDIRKVIKFLFVPQKGTNESLISPDVDLIKFIVQRLIKFNCRGISMENYNSILSSNDSNEILSLLENQKIALKHAEYIRHQPEVIIE